MSNSSSLLQAQAKDCLSYVTVLLGYKIFI